MHVRVCVCVNVCGKVAKGACLENLSKTVFQSKCSPEGFDHYLIPGRAFLLAWVIYFQILKSRYDMMFPQTHQLCVASPRGVFVSTPHRAS